MHEPEDRERRFYPAAPVAGVGAIIVKDGKVLLIKRGQEPNKGKWTVPGGVIEVGETIEEALEREVREECSIDIEVEKVATALDAIDRDDDGRVRYHYVIIDMLAKHIGGEIKAASDAAECRWVTPEELKELDTTPLLKTVLERVGII